MPFPTCVPCQSPASRLSSPGCDLLSWRRRNAPHGPPFSSTILGISPPNPGSRESEAANIFRHAGIEVEWVDCPVRLCRPAMDSPPRPPVEFRDSFRRCLKVSAQMPSVSASGTWLSCSLERIEQFAAAEGGGFTRILGSIIAHEVGRLLMPKQGHSVYGVMRLVGA